MTPFFRMTGTARGKFFPKKYFSQKNFPKKRNFQGQFCVKKFRVKNAKKCVKNFVLKTLKNYPPVQVGGKKLFSNPIVLNLGKLLIFLLNKGRIFYFYFNLQIKYSSISTSLTIKISRNIFLSPLTCTELLQKKRRQCNRQKQQPISK